MSSHVSRLSSVHRGIAFEQRSLQLLELHLSMSLRRVGGKSDGGIDLVGWWWLPFIPDPARHCPDALHDADGLPRRRLRVLAQCKAEKKKFSPKYVREMEGVWHLRSRSPSPPDAHLSESSSLPPSSSTAPDLYPTVSLLLSESPFSRSTALHAYRSTVPFLLVHLPCPSSSSQKSPSTSAGVMEEMAAVFPNPVLTHLVKPLGFCWEHNPVAATGPRAMTESGLSGHARPGLWWQGRKLNSWTPASAKMRLAMQ